ncbi:hypothetical protein [Spirochaeta isovalerica]|uniref:DUF4384 domain-containing protein n=1 Tax=Spirochaeta isovalerica TaxID=150 RepID=A0A841R1D0_9SPIO|nr:hypothetical protein [Spirochaeta isovalerica]MBB6478784.1 hypothetical protein [Spirochaeta isovalerica]
MKNKVNHELHYEQIALGELKPENEYDKDKIRSIEESNQKILKEYPPELMAAQIKMRMNEPNRDAVQNRRIFRRIYIPLSAAAVFLLFIAIYPVLFERTGTNTSMESDTVRFKGNGPSLYIYRNENGETELLGNNTIVKEKDLLQISYDAQGARYGVIFSIDGRGAVTLHFPGNIYSSTRLDSGGKVLLPYSYELDNAPFFERFFFVTSEHEIDASVIMEKAGRIAKGNKSEMLILPEDQRQQSMILFKEEVE